MTDQLEFVTCCGLYCELCAERARIPRQAAALQHAMTEEGWPYWGHTVPGFTEFWQFLERLYNRRLQAVGLEQWLDEQRERAQRDFVYADIRYRE
jgi:hypothetical protein